MSIVPPRGMAVTEAYRLYRSSNLLVNRKYQRKLIWSVEEKEKLIGSILKGYPIPLILLAERPQVHGSGKYEIIDGMQRLNAICSFIENSFAFEGKFFDLNEFSYAKQLAEEKVFKFENNTEKLDRKECANILDYQLAVTIYTAMDESDITEVFGRINSGGKHLSNQERRQAGVTTSLLTNPLKTQVLMKIDTINYKGRSVIRINIPSQKEVSFVGDKAFTREHSSTVEAKGPKLLAVSQLFQK